MRRTLALVLVIASAFFAVPRPQTTEAQTTIIIITIVGPSTTTYGLPGGGSASASMARGTGTFGGGNFATGRGSVMIIVTTTVTMTVGPNSSGTLNGSADGSASSVSNPQGQLHAKAAGKFAINMPTGCACVRGTELTVEARTGWMRQRTYDGVVEVRNNNARVSVGKGFETVVRGSAAPTRPAPFKFPARPFWE